MIHPFFRRDRFRAAASAVLLLALVALAGACATPRQPVMPVGNLALGVAPFSQPRGSSEMLAGYMPEDAPVIDANVFADLDGVFGSVLVSKSKHKYVSAAVAEQCRRSVSKQPGSGNQAALRTWSAVGRCMKVDLLVVPQLLDWRERDGGTIGVAKPAKVVMDIFVVDVRNEALISRSRYDETQSALTSNLLEAGKFFKRGGKWVEARDLAREGMEKAVKELGL